MWCDVLCVFLTLPLLQNVKCTFKQAEDFQTIAGCGKTRANERIILYCKCANAFRKSTNEYMCIEMRWRNCANQTAQ